LFETLCSGAKEGQEKNFHLSAMDVEENLTSTVDRQKNEPISFGRSEAQTITRSDNHLIKVTLFWSRNESKRVTGTGHYAWTSRRTQETWETAVALALRHQGSYRPMFGSFERHSTRQEKMVHADGRKVSE
jgi:hypothetical protein